MSVHFKYKAQANYEYAPGYVSMGNDGDKGATGKSGNNLYFSNFNLDNSYDIDMALQKIENNYILSDQVKVELKDRSYKVGDIIMSSNGSIYRIKESSAMSLYKNYKFDIEKIGKLRKESYNDISEVKIFDFTGCEFYDEYLNLIRKFNPVTKTPVPNHREHFPINKNANLPSSDTDITEMTGQYMSIPGYPSCPPVDNDMHQDPRQKYAFNLYGAWIKIIGISSTNITENTEYSLRIDLKNTKYLQGITAPETNPDYIGAPGCAKYRDSLTKKETDASYKTFVPMEFSNISVYTKENYDTNIVLGDMLKEFKINTVSIPKPKIPTRYLSDYSMDLMHPSGNNLKYTLDSSRGYWYMSGKGSRWTWDEDDTYKNYPPDYYDSEDILVRVGLRLGKGSYTDIDDDIKEETCNEKYNYEDIAAQGLARLLCDVTEERWGSGNRFYTDLAKYGLDRFPKYAIGGALTTSTVFGYKSPQRDGAWDQGWIQTFLDQDSMYGGNFYTQYGSTRQKFPETQDFFIRQYDRHTEQGRVVNNFKSGDSTYFSSLIPSSVPDSIVSYITASANKYYITSRDKLTKEFGMSEINVTVDRTSFRNAKWILMHNVGGEVIAARKVTDEEFEAYRESLTPQEDTNDNNS